MARKRSFWLVVAALLACLGALAPVAALAQGADRSADREFTLKINGDYRVAASDRVGAVVVIRGDAIVDGTVDDALVVIDGDATVSGIVQDVVVVNGTLTLAGGSRVDNVSTYRSELVRDAGATVTGSIHERSEISLGWFPVVFGIVMWIGSTIAVLAAGALFAAVGGAQLRAGAAAMTEHVGGSVLAAVLLFIVVPLAAVISIVTIVGAPVGIAVLLFVLPAIALAGYLAFGEMLGALILRTAAGAGADGAPAHPYRETLLGVAILQVFALVPLGMLAMLFGAAWGAGALVLVAWRAARSASPTGARAPSAPAPA